MKFIVSSSQLLAQLQTIKSVINSKNTMPILDNFLFQLDGNALKITASDLETTLNTTIEPSHAEGQGAIAIEARRLTDILKELQEQPLSFRVNQENYQVEISTQNGKYSVVGHNAEDFPRLPRLDESQAARLRLPATVMQKAISNTIFATADDDLRPVMNGILMELAPDYFRAVSSDSHKLVRYTRKDIKPGITAQFILHKKPANIIKGMLSKCKSEIEVSFDAKNAFFEIDSYRIICRLVEGKYPSYNSVIPANNPFKLRIDRLEFYNSIKRVSIFSSQASNLVKLSLLGNEVEVTAQDLDFSIAAEERVLCDYQGDQMAIGFKSTFLLEILSNVDSSDISLEMSDPSRAGIITPIESDEDGEDVLMLIMPMMV